MYSLNRNYVKIKRKDKCVTLENATVAAAAAASTLPSKEGKWYFFYIHLKRKVYKITNIKCKFYSNCSDFHSVTPLLANGFCFTCCRGMDFCVWDFRLYSSRGKGAKNFHQNREILLYMPMNSFWGIKICMKMS